MKTTGITLKSLMAKKEAILAAKKDRKTAKVYVKSLDGTVTVSAPERAVVMEAQEMGAGRGDGCVKLVKDLKQLIKRHLSKHHYNSNVCWIF